MLAALQTDAGEVARRLLLHHRIGEPVSFTPIFDGHTGTWRPEGREVQFLSDIGRTDLHRGSLSLRIAASTAGDPEELVHLVLAGLSVLALRLCRFAATAHYENEKAAALDQDIRITQINRELHYLTGCLGAELFQKSTESGHENSLAREARF